MPVGEKAAAQPSRIAVWLLKLFAPREQAEPILGDLFEEFSQLVLTSGVASARRWHWRQTTKTIAHLVATGFRIAPWSTTAAVVGGFMLCGLVSGLPNKLLNAITDRYLAYWSSHFGIYVFLATDGMLIAQFIGSMFVGSVVALAAKGREIVVGATLNLVLVALAIPSLLLVASVGGMGMLVVRLKLLCCELLGIIIGGAIVRRLVGKRNLSQSS